MNKNKNMPKVLTLDIETAPIKSFHWGLWDQNIGLEQIDVEWSILSFSAKWLGKSKVIYMDTGGRGVNKVRDDKALCQALRDLLDEADLVVAQNGQKFDIKKINSRLIELDIPPYSPIRVIDTLLVAKKHFGHTSNKLDWQAAHLTDTPKSKHKKFPGFELWSECLNDNPKAWAEMKKYNVKDTVATEKLYLKQRPWISGHPNLGTYNDSTDSTCPKCDSPELQRRGEAVTQAGRYQRYQCLNCGGWSRGKQMLNTLAVRKTKLTN